MKNLLIFCTLGFSIYSHAQTTNPYNSGKVLKEAIDFHDKGEYKKAIALYKTIPRNDTNYVKALYEISLSCYYDSSYKEGLWACDEALQQGSIDTELDLLISKGNLLDELFGSVRALGFYDSALLKYPQSQALHFNRAITLLNTNKMTEAEAIFQNLVIQNPYYASAHLRLATCALKQGRMVPAMMSLITYLAISPQGVHYKTCISSLGELSKVTPELLETVEKRETQEPTFTHAEQTILSKVSLDNQFKLLAELDDPIVRQLQAMAEVVSYDEESTDFWMQYYVPMFKTILEQKQFEPLIMHSFSALDIESIKRYLKKNEKEVNNTINTIVDYLNTIRSTREVRYSKRKIVPATYYYEDNIWVGTGEMNAKDDMVGSWTFYYPNGNIKAIGTYTQDGKKTGDWTYYYANGNKSGTDKWINGIQEGEDVIFSESGTIASMAHYSNGKLNGEKKTFYAVGSTKAIANYKDDVQSGKYVEFYSSGRKRIEADVENDKFHGSYKSYHQSGESEAIATYKEGNLNGPYKTFHENGQPSFEATYSDGKLNGQAISYHENGKIKQKSFYKDDLLEGKDEEFNDQEVLTTVINYVNGKAEGLASYYDDDSKLYSTLLFDKNILKEAKYFDKQGQQVASSVRKNKSIALTVFGPQSYKLSFTNYNDAGKIIGDNHYYYPTGKIKETNTYKDGQVQGSSTGFYENGQKSYEIAYQDNEKNGLANYYHFNGKLRLSGWFKGGSEDGSWTAYNEKGHIQSKYTYLNNDLHGYYSHHYTNGKLDYEEHYNLGWLTGITTYDTLGNVISSAALTNGNGIYKNVHLNGKKKSEGTFSNGELHGPFTSYFFDETVELKKSYDKGILNGSYTLFHHGGKTAASGTYKMGKRSGTWKYFDTDGKLWREEYYENGELNGIVKVYSSNGKLDREMEYKKGELNGAFKRYSEDGQLIHVCYYKNDLIYAYAHTDKDQKLTSPQPLPSGTGKLVSYYSNGRKSAEIDYTDGKVNGLLQLFHTNGKLSYETKEQYGNTEGFLKKFYENGAKKAIYHYEINNLNGPYKEFHLNGTLKEEGEFYNDERHGLFKYYDANGKLTLQENYYYGTLISIRK